GAGGPRGGSERSAAPGRGRLLSELPYAKLTPWAASRVNFRNDRAPLLLVVGSEDRLTPPSLVRGTYEKYAQFTAVTAYKEFPHRSHLIIAQDGWREVARCVLQWAESWTTGKVSSPRLDPVLG